MMEHQTQPVSETELDEVLERAVDDLDRAVKGRVLKRLLDDAEARGDHEVRAVLEPMLRKVTDNCTHY